jgi:RNA-directed DNA polymerase
MKDGILRKWSPVRQKEIPKKNGKMRTLGIPTLRDRAYQAKLKGIIEPCYEVVAEPNTYGFRPMRCTMDAIQRIYQVVSTNKETWVLEGDLKGFFDNIKTSAITDNEIIDGNGEITATIRRLVKSGAVNPMGEYVETSKGTPQGSVISPLLANIAFNGLETMINELAWENRERTGQKSRLWKQVFTIVYADDFVIIAKKKWIIEELKKVIADWCLEKMGIELSEEKTRITSTMEGFDFLGCNIRRYEVNSTKKKTRVKPSKDSIKGIKRKIKAACQKGAGQTPEELIDTLNPILIGWGNYHKGNVASRIFAQIDNYVFWELWRWARKKHPNKERRWIKDKYWRRMGKRKWVFRTEDSTLKSLKDIKIERHIKIKSEHHVYDGEKEYWAKRLLMKKGLTRTQKVVKRQGGKCAYCGEFFKYDSVIEIDHVIPKSRGGKDEMSNLQALHRHCHHRKTKTDGSLDQRRNSKNK